jgi:hypothetical protein
MRHFMRIGFFRLDGRPHLPANVKLWEGDGRARWDGDTLVDRHDKSNRQAVV